MKITILEDKKNKISMKITGESSTLIGALKKELWNDSNVKIAAYNIDHPLVGQPTLIVETSNEEPRKAIEKALKSLDKTLGKIQESAKKL